MTVIITKLTKKYVSKQYWLYIIMRTSFLLSWSLANIKEIASNRIIVLLEELII